MLLSDQGIGQAIREGQLSVDPLDRDLIQPASIDVRLGRTFRVMQGSAHGFLNPRDGFPGSSTLVEVPDGKPFELWPLQFVLGHTVETLRLGATVAGQLAGKSTLARFGLVIHSTAGWIDPGFHGQITLELSACQPIQLWPGDPVGQVAFFQTNCPAVRPDGHAGLRSRYQNQAGPTPARPAPR
jgi:dCTP deaminase